MLIYSLNKDFIETFWECLEKEYLVLQFFCLCACKPNCWVFLSIYCCFNSLPEIDKKGGQRIGQHCSATALIFRSLIKMLFS